MEKIIQLGKVTGVALTEKLYTSNLDIRNDGEYHVSVVIRFTYETEASESKFAAAMSKLPEKVRQKLAKISGGDNMYHCIEFADLLLDDDDLDKLWPKVEGDDGGEPTRVAATKSQQMSIKEKVKKLLQDDDKNFIEYPFTTVVITATDVLESANVTKGLKDGKEISFSSIYSLAKKRAYPFFYRSRFGERSESYCERVGNNLLAKNTAKLLERADFCPDSENGWECYDAYVNKGKKNKSINVPKDDAEFDLDLDE